MNDRYYELFEKSADPILIIEEGYQFIDCNEAAVRILGYKSKEALLNVHPADLSPIRQPDGQLSQDKANVIIDKAFKEGACRFEWYHNRLNGELFPVEVSLTAVTEGSRKTLHVIWRGISSQKTAEEASRRLTSII